MGRLRRIGYFAEYALIRLLGSLINLLPFPAAFSFARGAGNLLYYLLPPHREKALENLREAFKEEKSEAEIRQIAKESFVYLAEFTVGWLRMPVIAKHPERYLGIQGVEKIWQGLEKKNGALLLVSHGGHWEIAALIVGLLVAKPVGTTIHALARPLKNPYLYDYVLRLRGLTGLRSISKFGAVRATFERLKKNEIVSLLIDQRVGEGSVDVKFFHRPALTTGLPAVAALRLGTPVFFLFIERQPGPRYVMTVEGTPPLENTGEIERDIQTNTQRFNDRLETKIRENPGHWLWMHNRWRAQHGAKD